MKASLQDRPCRPSTAIPKCLHPEAGIALGASEGTHRFIHIHIGVPVRDLRYSLPNKPVIVGVIARHVWPGPA
jgi:hypothetical protein